MEEDEVVVQVVNKFADAKFKVSRRRKTYICSYCKTSFRTQKQLDFHHSNLHENSNRDKRIGGLSNNGLISKIMSDSRVEIKIDPDLPKDVINEVSSYFFS